MCLFPKPTCNSLFHNIYCRLDNLKVLQNLILSCNLFEEVPAVVYKLTSLKYLSLSRNSKLLKIDEQLLQLIHLVRIDCEDCYFLKHPPHHVCSKGLSKIKEYFIKLRGMSQSCLLYVTELFTLCHRVVYSMSESCLLYVTELSTLCHRVVYSMSQSCLLYVTELSTL